MEFGFWILDFGFWILDFGFWILDLEFWILDFGFWILDFGFWSLDFGFWILDQFSIRSFCGGPKRRRLDFGFWILDFGFWILEFGFWILDFGFWILEFGFWILDFGFWILVWMRPYSTSFGSCIRYFHVTPTRVGGFYQELGETMRDFPLFSFLILRGARVAIEASPAVSGDSGYASCGSLLAQRGNPIGTWL